MTRHLQTYLSLCTTVPVEALNFCFPLDFSIGEPTLAVLCRKTLNSADLHLQSSSGGYRDASRKNVVIELLITHKELFRKLLYDVENIVRKKLHCIFSWMEHTGIKETDKL